MLCKLHILILEVSHMTMRDSPLTLGLQCTKQQITFINVVITNEVQFLKDKGKQKFEHSIIF